MKAVRFIADNPTAALAQIHAQFGPDAVVLDVRPVPVSGLARLWPGPRRVEVLAGVPEPPPPSASVSAGSSPAFSLPEEMLRPDSLAVSPEAAPLWPTVAWMAERGLLPEHARRFQAHLGARHPGPRPGAVEAEWRMVSSALAGFWSEPPAMGEPGGSLRPHVFVGPPGSGKTTALCKWLTLAVLIEEKRAEVRRLDSEIANTAEFLGIHCEMLGVPVRRFWAGPEPLTDFLLVDLPGVAVDDAAGLAALRAQLASLPSPRIHLVLNAACEMAVLLAQWRAFVACEPEDLIFTHLDEEQGRVKLWNFVFGTNCSLRFLGAGQKIPGEFRRAAPGLLFPQKTPEKRVFGPS